MVQAQRTERTHNRPDTAPEQVQQKSSSGLSYVFNDTILKENTGRFLPRAKYLAGQDDQERLLKQTRDMAERLEAAGFKAKAPSQISMIMDVTGEVFEVEAWRNINVLPAVAQKNRREMMRDLEHYFHRHGKQYWRYAVITFGDRLPAFSDLSGAVRAAKKKVRKWRHLAKRDFGVTFGFIGFEFPRDADGTYHLHVNVMYRTPLFIDKGNAWRKFTHDFFGSWWRDAGQIANLKEMLKYPFKPNDVEGCDGDELVWLAEQMFNLRITELLGPVQELRKQRRDAGLKVAVVRGSPILRTPYKRPKTQSEIDAEAARREREEAEGKQERKGEAFNIIIGRVMPSFRASPWAESATLVFNYNPNAFWDRDRERLVYLQQNQSQAREIWDAKGCPDPKTALAFAKAIRTTDNVVAFRDARQKARSERDAGEARYIVHNETISVPIEFDDVISQWEGAGDNVIELWSEPDEEPPDPMPPAPQKFLSIFKNVVPVSGSDEDWSDVPF